jgi:Na+/melibiose symporter-like transporter
LCNHEFLRIHRRKVKWKEDFELSFLSLICFASNQTTHREKYCFSSTVTKLTYSTTKKKKDSKIKPLFKRHIQELKTTKKVWSLRHFFFLLVALLSFSHSSSFFFFFCIFQVDHYISLSTSLSSYFFWVSCTYSNYSLLLGC